MSDQQKLSERLQARLVLQQGWFKLTMDDVREIQALETQRDALAAALRAVIKAQRGVACEVHKPLRSPLCLRCQLDARSEEAREALVALERTAPADGGKA